MLVCAGLGQALIPTHNSEAGAHPLSSPCPGSAAGRCCGPLPPYLLAACPHHAYAKFVCNCGEEDALQGQQFAVGLVRQAPAAALLCLQPDAHTGQALRRVVGRCTRQSRNASVRGTAAQGAGQAGRQVHRLLRLLLRTGLSAAAVTK